MKQEPKEFDLWEVMWMAKKINNGSIADWSVSLEGVRQLAKAIVEMEKTYESGIQFEDMLGQIEIRCTPSNNPDPGGLY